MHRAALALSLLGCGISEGKGPASDNGQTGSIGSAECSANPDCLAEAEHLLDPLRTPQPSAHDVTGGSCSALAWQIGTEWYEGFACECTVAGGGSLPLGPPGVPCSVYGRAGDCLWDTTSFPDCSEQDPSFCDGACAELDALLEADASRVFDVAVRLARCDGQKCEIVLRVEDRCYANNLNQAYNCSLEDEEILDRAVNGAP